MTRMLKTIRLDPPRWTDAPAEVIAELSVGPTADLQIDATDVHALPALSCQILLAAQRQAVATGGSCGLISVSDRLRSGLALLGMEHLIQEPRA